MLPAITGRSLALRASAFAAARVVPHLAKLARTCLLARKATMPGHTITTRPQVKVEPEPPKKQAFHVQPSKGWINDPNGPFWDPSTKLYHMFYQHFPKGDQWSWGLSWGHAVSADLVNWAHLPVAMSPTPGGVDAEGVWSGCAFMGPNGPVILNTAVRQRSKTAAHHLPPAENDIGIGHIEAQMCATPVPGDPLLKRWVKGSSPMLPFPHTNNLTGWRDPFLVGRPGDGLHSKWTMLLGAGVPQEAGNALLYTSDDPTSGWELQGELCRGKGDTGTVWECPLLFKVPVKPHHPEHPESGGILAAAVPLEADGHAHALCICPENAHHAALYSLGQYDGAAGKFDLESAPALQPLDLGGHTFYAPNVFNGDPQGRAIMLGWCQETGRPEGSYPYACCLSVPRLLWRHPTDPTRLWQEPLPQLMAQLQQPHAAPAADPAADPAASAAPWHAQGLQLLPGEPLPLPGALRSSAHLMLTVTFQPTTDNGSAAGSPAAPVKSGLLLRSHPEGDVSVGEVSGRNGAALLYDWESQRLDVVFSDGVVPLELLAELPSSTYSLLNRYSRAATASGMTDDQEASVERRSLNIQGCHAVGGPLYHASAAPSAAAASSAASHRQPLTLTVFLDHSLLEVFTSTGQVLTTRVYRDFAPPSATTTTSPARAEAAAEVSGSGIEQQHVGASVELVSFGGATTVASVSAAAARSAWVTPEEVLVAAGWQPGQAAAVVAGADPAVAAGVHVWPKKGATDGSAGGPGKRPVFEISVSCGIESPRRAVALV